MDENVEYCKSFLIAFDYLFSKEGLQISTKWRMLMYGNASLMNLAPDLIAQTTVAKVGCPECGAMGTLHPQGNTVMFPSHPKRLTSTPRDEVRWIRRGTTWELSDKKASFTETERE
jgi:hypothetical protein